MKKMKGIKVWSAACAMLLAVSCLATMVFVGSAAEPDTYTAQSEYVCRIAADDMTNTPPYASAGVTDGFGSRESDGRVWVDKSVQANNASNAFDVTLSALAQEYSYSEETIETIMEQNAADVLFILDFSSSMVGTSSNMKDDQGNTVGYRLKVLSDSLNAAMKEIAEVNPYNRIMAVAFDGSAYDFLPLGSYTAGTNGNYVEFANNTISTAAGVKFTGVIDGVEYTSAEKSFSKKSGNGTHMQIGITYGCDQLLQNMTNGFGEGKRLPFVMVMTDGESNYSNDNWAGVNLASNNGTSTQREANSTLASTFWKKRLIDAYNAKNAANGFEDSDVNAVWFNIGVGLGDPGDAGNSASAVQVSMKPSFANPDATSTSNAGKIYTQILTRLENAYNNPQDYVGDPLNGYDDLLARAGIDVEALRTAVSTAVSTAESNFNAKLADPNSDEAKAIKAAGETAAEKVLYDGNKNNYANLDDFHKYVKNTYGLEYNKGKYKNKDTQFYADVEAKVTEAAAQAQSDAEAAKKAELYDAAVGNVEEQAMADAMEAQGLAIEDLTDAVQGYFEKFIREYMGYDGATQAERQANYAKKPMHYFAEYVNYADTSTKVNDSFDQLASLISAATQGTVIPITHHATSGAAADEIFITFTDPLGKGTTIKTDDDGNYIMSIVLKGVTYTGRPKSGAATGVYEFYNETEDKVLYSTATISDSSVKWEINAYELPIVRFANRMLPGEPVNGEIYEDPNLAPIAVKYEVMPTADALANTATNGNFIYEHDDIASAPAKAVFTPTPANTYYFKNNGTEKVTAIEKTIDKATGANKSETAYYNTDSPNPPAYVTDSFWGTGDDEDDFIILLGNDARTKVLAEVSIEDDRMEDAAGVTAHTYGTDETITYTLKVKNLSDEKLENLTYTLDVTPSGPASTDTPSALTVGTCSTTPDSTVKSGNKQTLTFTLDELAAGATKTVTVPMTPATGTKNGVTVDAVITLTKVFNTALVTPATDEVGEVLIAEDATVYTYLDGAKTNLTGITGAPSTLYIKKDGGNYIALTKDTPTATYIATNIPIGEYTIYDGNSGTPNALGKVSVVKDGDNIGNVYWKTLTLAKAWDDNNNQDGKRADVTLTLYRQIEGGDKTKVDDYALTSANAVTGNTNQWQKQYVVLAKDASGNDYIFTIDELDANVPTGYTKSVSGLTVTNKHTPETTSVTLKKKWDDNSNQDAKRPVNITLTLYKQPDGGTKTKLDDYTFNGTGNEWTKTVENLPKYEGGKLITYSVDELDANTPEGYSKAVSGLTVTNTYTPEVTSATLKKVWNDNSDQDGKRPESVVLSLYKTVNSETTFVQDVTIEKPATFSNEWTETVLDLAKYEGGQLVTYTADEKAANVPTNYTKESASGLVVTNKHTPATKDVTITKVWDDADFNGKDGYSRPASISIALTAKVNNVKVDSLCKTATMTVSDVNTENANEWIYTFTGLPVYNGGSEIAYTVSETTPTGYKTPTVDGEKITNTPKDVSEAYNSVSLTVSKLDKNNDAGLKGAVFTATATGITDVTGTTDATGAATLTFVKPGTYTVSETTPPTGYKTNSTTYTIEVKKTFKTMTYDSTSGKWVWTYDLSIDTTASATLTDSKLVVKDEPTICSATLTKKWNDNSDQDGKRPTSIVLSLYKTVNNVTTFVQDVTIDKPAISGNEWMKTVENLPAYESGYAVTYTADEKPANVPTDYTKESASGLVVTNKHVPEVKTISGTKTWNDTDYVGKTGYTRPSITVNLIAKVDGVKVDALCKTTTATATSEWKYSFAGVPVYHGGKEVVYTVEEAAVDGFTPSVTDFNIQNTPLDKDEVLKPVTLTIKKVDSLTTTGKGLKNASFEMTYTDEEGVWRESTYVTDENGVATIEFKHDGVYTIKESVAPTGYQIDTTVYTATVSRNFVSVALNDTKTLWHWNYDLSYLLTGVLDGVLTVKDEPIKTPSTTLTKVWDDNQNQDGVRPTSVVFGLYKTVNDTKTKVQDVTLTGGTTAESWTKIVENLPIYEDGYPVTYTIEEETDQLGDEYSLKSVDNDTLTITNFHKPGVTSATLKKVWDDNSDQDGKRPANVTLTLYKTVNGETTALENYTFSGEGNEWTKKVDDLPKFESGYAVVYTADELADNVPEGYEKSADGLTVTNTHEPETTDVTVKKVWEDNSDQDGFRPDDVTLTLYKTVDGDTAKVQDVTFGGEGNEWTKTIEDLPVYEDGFEIVYTADETDGNLPEGYEKSADGLTVTNTHEPETTDVTVKKVWEDNSDQDGFRPDDVTLTLYKTVDGDTAKVQDVTFGGDGNEWTKTIEDLPVYENGFEIVYTADETDGNLPEGYEKSADGLTVTNTHEPETTDVTLTKVWADENNVDDTRPVNVTLTLYKTVDGDTAKVQDVTLAGNGNEWTKTIEDLPVYENGFEIVYTADETDGNLPEGYEKSADGLTVTNTRTVERTITVTVEGGTASNGTSTVTYGDDFTTTFTPDEGKVILSVVIDGEEVKIVDGLTYDFTDVTKNHEIVVKFADDKNGNGVPDIFEAQVTYQVENGTWSDGTTDDIVENFVLKELKDGAWTDTNATLGNTIPTGMTPDEFYTDNGKWNTEITPDTAVTTNATYRYTFGDEKTHTVTIEIQNGTTDPDQGSFPVKHKDDQDVKITPDKHYVIDKIVVDGEEVEIPEDGTLHFTDIVTDHDIQVICEEDANDDMIADKYQATVTVDMDNEDAGSVSGDGVYWKGETATVTATPSTGYRFIGWMLDGEIVSYDPEYTFTADENVKLIGLFEKLETPTEAPTTTTTTTVPTTAPEAPKTGDALPSAALLLTLAAAGVLFASRKRENEE